MSGLGFGPVEMKVPMKHDARSKTKRKGSWKWKCTSRVQSGAACGVCMQINFKILV
jgi:hypothetical protein